MTPYQPDELPISNLDYQPLFSLVGEANAESNSFPRSAW